MKMNELHLSKTLISADFSFLLNRTQPKTD